MNCLSKFTSFFKNPIFKNCNFLFAVWVVVALAGGALKYFNGAIHNYHTFITSYFDATSLLNLYPPYEDSAHGMFHYGPFFTAIISPFAILPDLCGLLLWLFFGAALLFFAIKKLPIDNIGRVIIIWFCVNELFTTAAMQQFNIHIAATIILSFICIENKRDFWAAMFIMFGFFTKIYGVVGFAFFLFSKNKPRLVLSCLFWAAVMFVLPMLFTSYDYVISQYGGWIADIASKNSENMFSTHQNISLLGLVRKFSGDPYYSDLWLIIPGLILFALPYLRLKQYAAKGFRLMMLSSVLLFVILFSSGSESSTYIIAFLGVGIWYTTTLSKTKNLNLALLVSVFVFSSLLPTDLFPRYIRNNYMVIKALPVMLVWFKVIYELYTTDFRPAIDSKIKSINRKDIDIILPCYNPTHDWVERVIEGYNALCIAFTANRFHIIVSDDGSSVNISQGHIDKLKASIPDAKVISSGVNYGKGHAVRAGVEVSKSAFVLYTDIDFPYTVESMKQVINALNKGNDIVIGIRNQTYYKELTPKRKILSFCSKIFNAVVLNLKHNDTQGGLKAFTRKGADILISTRTNRYLFDTEFIYKAAHKRDIKIVDVEVNLRDGVFLSGMSFKTIMREVLNFAKIMTS